MIFRDLRKAVLVGVLLLGLAFVCAGLLGVALSKTGSAADAIERTVPLP